MFHSDLEGAVIHKIKNEQSILDFESNRVVLLSIGLNNSHLLNLFAKRLEQGLFLVIEIDHDEEKDFFPAFLMDYRLHVFVKKKDSNKLHFLNGSDAMIEVKTKNKEWLMST